MQGQTETLLPSDPVPCAFEYRFLTDALVPLREPVGENILIGGRKGYDCGDESTIPQWVRDHALGASYLGNTNMVCEFVRAYTEKTGWNVIAVHAAKGSSSISEWQKGMPYYDALMEKSKSAIAKAGAENIAEKYFIFLQGESDALANTPKDEYKRLLVRFARDVKTELATDKFCVIKVGAFASFLGAKGDGNIFAAQEEVCAEDGDFLMLTRITEELVSCSEYMNPRFVGHFGAKAQQLIGRHAGGRLGLYAAGKPFKEE